MQNELKLSDLTLKDQSVVANNAIVQNCELEGNSLVLGDVTGEEATTALLDVRTKDSVFCCNEASPIEESLDASEAWYCDDTSTSLPPGTGYNDARVRSHIAAKYGVMI